MRFGFRESMEQYGEIAKDESEAKRRAQEKEASKKLAAEESPQGGGAVQAEEESPRGREVGQAEDDVRSLDEVLKWHMEKRARKTDTSLEAQGEVYGVQKEKQEVMARLKQDLAALDDPEAKEFVPEGARSVTMRDGKLLCTLENGKQVEVTMGDIVTDGVWGLDYALDSATVPRLLRKRVMVERARREIENLLDEQILIEETDSSRTHEFTREAYEAIKARRESGELPMGIVAERMITQIARKAIIDDDEPYKYENADVFQDVNQKIDFIIRRADHGRGVKVEEGAQEGEMLESKGVQLTINSNPEALQRKQQQIDRSRSKLVEDDRIDDIALMKVDMRILGGVYDQWKKNKTPGGPDKLMSKTFKQRLFREMTSGMEPK